MQSMSMSFPWDHAGKSHRAVLSNKVDIDDKSSVPKTTKLLGTQSLCYHKPAMQMKTLAAHMRLVASLTENVLSGQQHAARMSKCLQTIRLFVFVSWQIWSQNSEPRSRLERPCEEQYSSVLLTWSGEPAPNFMTNWNSQGIEFLQAGLDLMISGLMVLKLKLSIFLAQVSTTLWSKSSAALATRSPPSAVDPLR